MLKAVAYLGLARYMPHNQLAAVLVIFRGVYFLLPLMLAGGALATFELRSDAVRGEASGQSIGAAGRRPTRANIPQRHHIFDRRDVDSVRRDAGG